MKRLIQKILSHGLLIILVAAAFLAYTRRDEWFPTQHAASTAKVTKPAAEKLKPRKAAPVDRTSSTSSGSVSASPGQAASDKPVSAAPPVETGANVVPAPVAAETTGDRAETDAAQAPDTRPDTPEPVSEKAASAAQAAPASSTPADTSVGREAERASDSADEIATEAGEGAEPATLPAATDLNAVPDTQTASAPAAPGVTPVPDTAPAPVMAAPGVNAAPDTAPAPVPVVSGKEAGPDATALSAPAVPDASPVPETKPTPAVEPAPAPLAAAPEPLPVTEPAMSAPVAQTPPGPGVTLETQLQEAREYFWQRNLSAAEAAYRMLGETWPDNADVWGEIGDFYFNLRQRQPASRAYTRCIELLLSQGRWETAQRMLGVLYRLDARRARALENRMQQAGG